MRPEDARIGRKVFDRKTGLPMEIVGVYADGTVLCDFFDNPSDPWEYDVGELELKY